MHNGSIVLGKSVCFGLFNLQAPNAKGNLSMLLNAICVACKYVEAAVRKVKSDYMHPALC